MFSMTSFSHGFGTLWLIYYTHWDIIGKIVAIIMGGCTVTSKFSIAKYEAFDNSRIFFQNFHFSKNPKNTLKILGVIWSKIISGPPLMKSEIFSMNFIGPSCNLGSPKIHFKSFFQKSVQNIKCLLFGYEEF